jgi:hypothetical protein
MPPRVLNARSLHGLMYRSRFWAFAFDGVVGLRQCSDGRLNKVGASADLILHHSSTRIYCGLTTSSESGPAPATRMEVWSAHFCQHPPAFALHILVTLGYCTVSGDSPPRMRACNRVELRNASASCNTRSPPRYESHGCQHAYASRITPKTLVEFSETTSAMG